MMKRTLRLSRALTAAAAALAVGGGPPGGPNAEVRSDIPATATTPKPELRALWVDAFGEGLYTPAQIDRVIQSAVDANLNAVVAHIVWAGDCLCNKSVLPRADIGLAPAPFDPLEYIVQRGHEAGLQVHAWTNSTPAWRGSTAPRNPDHVYNRHGPIATGDDNWLTKRYDGETKAGDYYILDVGHPSAVDHIVDVFTSIVANYDVDGINIDRIRQPSHNAPDKFVPSWGYNPVALRRFQATTGRTDVPLPGDPQWKDWRRDQITNLVRRIYLGVHAVKPRVAVSADTIVWGPPPAQVGRWEKAQPYDVALQDWRGWLEEGILDLNLPMLYLPQHTDSGRAEFAGWTEYIKDHQYGRQAAVGVGLYENYIPGTIEQARNVLAPSAKGNSVIGWVGYSWRNPDIPALNRERPHSASRAELARALTQPSEYDPVTPAVFADAAVVPPMQDKIDPTTGHLSGTVRSPTGQAIDQLTIRLYKTGSRKEVATHVTDGSGWFGFVHLVPGRYTVRLDSRRLINQPARPFQITPGVQTQLNLCVTPRGTKGHC